MTLTPSETLGLAAAAWVIGIHSKGKSGSAHRQEWKDEFGCKDESYEDSA
jgi:hypothetical protein